MTDEPMMRGLARGRPAKVPLPGRSAAGLAHLQGADDGTARVLIVEDNDAMRDGLRALFESVGLETEAFASAMELSRAALPRVASCFVLDIRLPRLSGLDLQARLVDANIRIPIIFMTGHADIPMSARAMKAGAVDFLTKPFRDQDMIDAVTRAIELDRLRIGRDREAKEALARFSMLSQREREVMRLVTAGLMNKQVATQIGIAESTVKIHRAQVMKRMGARSLPDLVRMADLLCMPPPSSGDSLSAILDRT